jgi:hypothetical protein
MARAGLSPKEKLMDTHKIPALFVGLTLGAFGALAAAQPQASTSVMPPQTASVQESKPMAHSHEDRPMMGKEPHHVLAMAYHQNLLVFAKALQDETDRAGYVEVEFARAAEKEMRRSLAEMKLHHQGHVLTMNGAMQEQMNEMKKKMEKHNTELITMLDALEKEVNMEKPDAKRVSTMAANFYTHCSAMVDLEHKK